MQEAVPKKITLMDAFTSRANGQSAAANQRLVLKTEVAAKESSFQV
jgi:hypothetical protein